jgi:hypothetical protein
MAKERFMLQLPNWCHHVRHLQNMLLQYLLRPVFHLPIRYHRSQRLLLLPYLHHRLPLQRKHRLSHPLLLLLPQRIRERHCPVLHRRHLYRLVRPHQHQLVLDHPHRMQNWEHACTHRFGDHPLLLLLLLRRRRRRWLQ